MNENPKCCTKERGRDASDNNNGKTKTLCPFMSRVLVLRSKAEFHTVDCAKEKCELWKGKCTMGSKASASYRWVAVMDTYTCGQCAAHHDLIFDQSQINALSLDELPPLHGKDASHPFVCRCVIKKVNQSNDEN